MDEKEFPSSSDESDADFVPKEEDYQSESESEVSDNKDSEDEVKNKSRKRKKVNKRASKKAKTGTKQKKEKEVENVDDEDDDDNNENNESKKDEKKIDVDALWASFKKDVNSSEIKKTVEGSDATKPETQTKNNVAKSPQESNLKNLASLKSKGLTNFPNKSKVGGLSKVLNQIGKKDKMSTLQKSQLDWNKFKKNEGIEEEIKTYNRGKDGYLDKQDFLQRTDLRQFEIEKELRSSRRKF